MNDYIFYKNNSLALDLLKTTKYIPSRFIWKLFKSLKKFCVDYIKTTKIEIKNILRLEVFVKQT